MSTTILAPLEPRHLPPALAIQSQVYPAFLIEPAQAFASRLDAAASYCLAAERSGVLIAYLLAHGWPRESPPAIGAILDPACRGDVLFLHDLAVSPLARGSGAGRALVKHALARAAADGLRQAELIAIEGAADFWSRLGFVSGAPSSTLAAKVAAYGPHARWMTRPL